MTVPGLAPFLIGMAVAAGFAAPAYAARVDAGSLVAEERGGEIGFRQPRAPGATLRLVKVAPAGASWTLERVGEGLIRVRIEAPALTPRTAAGFARVEGERFLGFGERSDAIVRDGGTVQHRVTEGPFQDIEAPLLAAFIPLAGYNTRRDATYFPMPWLISTRGYGVLVEDDATSFHRLGSPWQVDIEGRRLTFLVVAGPTPREVLRRFSAHVGRQPVVRRSALGPWWQPRSGGPSDEQWIETLRSRGALGSVVQTPLHYLPCADHVGHRENERERTARFRDAGLANVTYFNPMICTSHPRYQEAAAHGWLTENVLGLPYVYLYTGATVFLVSQIDFSAPGAIDFYRSLTAEAIEDGHVGWMEDFGEYTPDDARAHDGATGSSAHNAYPREYHLGAHEAIGKRPLIRYVRSGWTGSAASSPVVWGGDPTTSWGFDGLASAVKTGLSMGLSGVSRWGSDIGGFFALSEPQTTPELLKRWIEMGFASGVMRTQGNGFDLGEIVSGRRSIIIDPDVLPVWARYARLRTRFLPEILDAERQYKRRGLPVMRHLSLTYPDDRRAVAREDQWLFGDDVLVAPVLQPGQRERTLYVPRGRWVDLWRSADPALRRLRQVSVLRGGREVTVPAPLDELPLLVRYGARLELLPRGGPSWRSAVRAGKRRRAILAFGGRTVRLRGSRPRRYTVQWFVPRRPRSLLVGSKRKSFRYRNGVLRVSVRAEDSTLRLNRNRR